MVTETNKQWFANTESIIDEPLKFKAKLAIGEDAYSSLKLKNSVFEVWDSAGVAFSAAALAKTSTVASTFFVPSGILGAIGIGTAVTPIGWIIAAGAVAGGTWLGLARYIKGQTNSKVTIIPNFINTPIDVLAIALFDLIPPLALKVAQIDGHIDEVERKAIRNYFVKEWGYNPGFVDEALSFSESRLDSLSIKELAQTLGEFKKVNKDCNYNAMSKEIIKFLTDVMESDGRVDEREEMAIEKIQVILTDINRFSLSEKAKNGLITLKTFSRRFNHKI
ncbi:TerB family tellurite resistance protein [Methylophaga sp.]|uniref:TerB family tellurite resistance protein n=1 Tax=Methylophaga sp. TaxID=2024840 RepID=UPI003A8C9775